MMSVLDALFWILESHDPTIAFRYSCRAGMCGSWSLQPRKTGVPASVPGKFLGVPGGPMMPPVSAMTAP